MSTRVSSKVSSLRTDNSQYNGNEAMASPSGEKNYHGFVAGIFSGIAKLTVGHPFDTIKVRLQTSHRAQFEGPLDCLLKTLRKEGFNGFYKGATPPLIGWMCMDSVMMGSLTLYRRILNEHVVQPWRTQSNRRANYMSDEESKRLPAVGHGIAGIFAGWTVSFIAAPVEHIKARLQVQYQANKAERPYTGPIDCVKKITRGHGVRGLYHGLYATIIFRTFFFTWWCTYDILDRLFQRHTDFSAPAINFLAGGLSAQVFWLTSYPSDVVKQRILTDSLGPDRKFPRWRHAAVAIYRESGWKGYWRGFVPCFIRAFPANAMALVAFEGVVRSLK